MTQHPTRPPAPPYPTTEHPVDLLMRALQTALPVALLDLMLDRIEAAR